MHTATIAEGLGQRNFCPSTQRVLQPLFAGITLDPTLSERIAFADFTWGAMSHGKMVMPREGIAAVPKQLAARLRSTDIRLNISVEGVSGIQRCGQRSSGDIRPCFSLCHNMLLEECYRNLSANTNPLSD